MSPGDPLCTGRNDLAFWLMLAHLLFKDKLFLVIIYPFDWTTFPDTYLGSFLVSFRFIVLSPVVINIYSLPLYH